MKPAPITPPPAVAAARPVVTEFPLAWPNGASGSTHELTFNRVAAPDSRALWVTGQAHDAVARVTLDGQPTFFPTPAGSGPHGIHFDAAGNLWVTLEFAGQLVQIDQSAGTILKTVDVALHAIGAPAPINTHPHGLGLDPDGVTLWFTGKATGTVGRVASDGTVTHFQLPTPGAVPVYVVAGPDGNMWCTELAGNKIARITPEGVVTEYPIPTPNSRPIGITPGPDGRSMWFSEEAGNKVGRILLDPVTYDFVALVEYPVPRLHANTLLASLAFDSVGNLWTQAYVDPGNPRPAGADAIVRLDGSIVWAPTSGDGGDISGVPVKYYEAPTAGTVMHRIIQGPDGNIWFTELGVDKLGRLNISDTSADAQRDRP